MVYKKNLRTHFFPNTLTQRVGNNRHALKRVAISKRVTYILCRSDSYSLHI